MILVFTLIWEGSVPAALPITTISPVIIKLPFLTAATLLLVDEEVVDDEDCASSSFSLSDFSVLSNLTELIPPVILLTPEELLVFGVVELLVFGVGLLPEVTGDWDDWPPVVVGLFGFEVVPPCGLVPFPTPEPLFWFPPLCEVPEFVLVVVVLPPLILVVALFSILVLSFCLSLLDDTFSSAWIIPSTFDIPADDIEDIEVNTVVNTCMLLAAIVALTDVFSWRPTPLQGPEGFWEFTSFIHCSIAPDWSWAYVKLCTDPLYDNTTLCDGFGIKISLVLEVQGSAYEYVNPWPNTMVVNIRNKNENIVFIIL